MSRIRSIHPGLWTDEAFVTLAPMARLLFMGIWNECDDMGSFEWSPLKLKMRILPADNVDAAELLDELLMAKEVMRYEVAGKHYGAVRNFCQFQRPKKANSTYPQTDEVREWVNTDARSTRDGSETRGKEFPTDGEKSRQMEDGGDKGKEHSEANASSFIETRARAKRIPIDWMPTKPLPPAVAKLCAQWPPGRVERELDGFRDYWLSRNRDAAKTDWDRTWWNRIRDQHDRVIRDEQSRRKQGGSTSGFGRTIDATTEFIKDFERGHTG